jgi:hypothetical protein
MLSKKTTVPLIVRGHCMCKEMPVIPNNRVVDTKRITGKIGGPRRQRGTRGHDTHPPTQKRYCKMHCWSRCVLWTCRDRFLRRPRLRSPGTRQRPCPMGRWWPSGRTRPASDCAAQPVTNVMFFKIFSQKKIMKNCLKKDCFSSETPLCMYSRTYLKREKETWAAAMT